MATPTNMNEKFKKKLYLKFLYLTYLFVLCGDIFYIKKFQHLDCENLWLSCINAIRGYSLFSLLSKPSSLDMRWLAWVVLASLRELNQPECDSSLLTDT